jgi:hypothetical protein
MVMDTLTPSRRRSIFWLALALTGVVVIALAGCGGQGSGSAPPTPRSTALTAADQAYVSKLSADAQLLVDANSDLEGILWDGPPWGFYQVKRALTDSRRIDQLSAKWQSIRPPSQRLTELGNVWKGNLLLASCSGEGIWRCFKHPGDEGQREAMKGFFDTYREAVAKLHGEAKRLGLPPDTIPTPEP